MGSQFKIDEAEVGTRRRGNFGLARLCAPHDSFPFWELFDCPLDDSNCRLMRFHDLRLAIIKSQHAFNNVKISNNIISNKLLLDYFKITSPICCYHYPD